MSARQYVDFSSVQPSHWKMHDRLTNWARWCNSRGAQAVAAGFGLHKSDEYTDREYGSETVIEVDKDDAVRIQKAIPQLPDKHRRAIAWCYVKPVKQSEKARELGLSLQGLADMVQAGRQMLINRGV